MGQIENSIREIPQEIDSTLHKNVSQTSGNTSVQPVMKLLLQAVVLLSITILAYLPATQCGFIWDDDRYVYENPLLRTPDGLYRIWFSKDSPSQYFPMVYTSFRLEYKLWGLNPHGYHITNILLHSINALLLWWLLRQLSISGAWIAAAIFALHPMQVESVAWITERKNLLVALFSFISLVMWVKFIYRSNRSEHMWLFYVLSLFFYLLALLSKTTACTLPVALVLILWLKHFSVDSKRWLQVMPYLFLGLAAGLLTIWWERWHQGVNQIDLDLNPVERVIIAGRALWFYIGKFIFPVNLTFSYPKWRIDATNPLQYTWLVVWIFTVFCLWRWRVKLGRGPLVAVVYFAATLSPMLGFISLFTFLYTYVADHYQYMACIGLITLVVASSCCILNKFCRFSKTIEAAIAVFVLLILGILTWNQCHIYKNQDVLWRDTVKKNPHSWLANNNLGTLLAAQDRYEEALGCFQEALKSGINEYFTYNNIGLLLQNKGHFEEAIQNYKKALEYKPDDFIIRYNLGTLYQSKGDLDYAIDYYKEAIEIRPDFANAHSNLGFVLVQKGQFEQAVHHFYTVTQLIPNDASAYANLAWALQSQGKLDEAIISYKKVLHLNPNDAKAYVLLGDALRLQGKIENAIEAYQKALQIDPNYIDARQKLEEVLKK